MLTKCNALSSKLSKGQWTCNNHPLNNWCQIVIYPADGNRDQECKWALEFSQEEVEVGSEPVKDWPIISRKFSILLAVIIP